MQCGNHWTHNQQFVCKAVSPFMVWYPELSVPTVCISQNRAQIVRHIQLSWDRIGIYKKTMNSVSIMAGYHETTTSVEVTLIFV